MDVVVTGIGLLTPFGRGVARTFDALLAGRSAIGPITRFDAKDQRSRIAAEVKDLEAGNDLPPDDLRTYDRFQLMAVLAALDAVRDAGLDGEPLGDRAAAIVGTGIGGIETIERNDEALRARGPRRVSPYFIPAAIPNLGASLVSMRVGARAVCVSPASACASGAHAIGEALWAIRAGRIDVAVAGGSEAAVTPLGVAGFSAMRALCERNDEPQRASRPFDRGRSGFVIGEGAGVLVLERADRAARRGAKVYAVLVGYGASADAHHITQPDPEAGGMARAMALALADGGLVPNDIGYINAHATSTPLGDRLEAKAIREVFGKNPPPVSSTKSALGHLLGAAGAVEAAIAVLALQRGMLPPTLNQEERDPDIDLDVVPNEARPVQARFALSNAFGFGGTNATLAFARP
jgi:3-oxoacyl-[acyl-carrier-protein] synthase II